MGKAGDWAFTKRFRRGGFGWRASQLASERIAEALAEIRAVARHDPLHAAEGAVRFLVKLSPALQQVDSSSGALGSAAHTAVDALVPVIAQASADAAVREKWLEQLFEAIQDDDPPYLELLDERWGDLCTTPEVASRWADRLMDLVRHVHAARSRGQHAFTRAESACYSALFAAGRHDELISLIGSDPRPMWHDLLWVGRCKVARGEIDVAIEFMTKAVNAWTPMAGQPKRPPLTCDQRAQQPLARSVESEHGDGRQGRTDIGMQERMNPRLPGHHVVRGFHIDQHIHRAEGKKA